MYRSVVDPLIIAVILAGALAGLVQGISGFAFVLVATAMLAWVLPPDMLVPVVICGAFVAQLSSIASVRAHFEVRRAAPFLSGGLLGLPLGFMLLRVIDVAVFRLCVGIALMVYCSIMLACRTFPVVRAGGRLADGGVGFIAGIMSGVCGLSGPPLTLWCALRGWPKEVQRATFQSFFIFTQIVLLPVFLWQGLLGPKTLLLVAAIVPASVAGSLMGARLFRRFSDQTFRTLIFVLLLLSGAALVFPAVHAAFS